MSAHCIVLRQTPSADGTCPEFLQNAPDELRSGHMRPEQLAFTYHGLVFAYSKVRYNGVIEYQQVETLELANL